MSKGCWGTGLAVGAALLLCASGTAAQAAVGVRAGANLSSLSGVQDTESIVGITAGGYLGFGIGDRVALQIEANYGVRGADGLSLGAGVLDDEATPSDIRLSAIEVPILLRAGFPGERLLPSVFLGPYVSFLLSCQLTPEDGSAGDCDDESREAWLSPRSTGYGLVAGGGLDLGLGESTIFIDVRYALGLVSIESGNDPIEAYNSGLSITGGFAFPLGR